MTLKVGVLEKDPFVINKDKLSGFTIDIWEYIAKKHNIEYSYHTIKNESDIDSAIDNNLYDVILGVIDLNADRIPKVDYTIPYYFTNFSLVNKKKDSNKEKIIELAKFSILIISYLVFTMTIYYFTAKDNISINEIIHYTFKNMSPYVAGARDTHILAKINYFFGFFFIILFVIGVYRLFYITEIISTVPKKPILVDSKSEVFTKYLKSRGAQVKVVKNNGGLNNLLDMYLSDPDNLAGVFVAEEGKIHNDGSIFNKNPKYQNLNFRRYNFGQNQVSIIMKKDHPLYANVNGELIKMREKGELFKISKKWLSYGQSLQLEI
jgi:ABC-type amino acid transport substrate-binding protein